MTPTEQNLSECKQLLSNIVDMATKAEAEQWEKPPRMQSEGGRRSPGEHSDPTGELATDFDRLTLRRAVQLTEKDSKKLLMALQLMHKRLAKATRPYGGA